MLKLSKSDDELALGSRSVEDIWCRVDRPQGVGNAMSTSCEHFSLHCSSGERPLSHAFAPPCEQSPSPSH
jgi:hypothetical protein